MDKKTTLQIEIDAIKKFRQYFVITLRSQLNFTLTDSGRDRKAKKMNY